MNENELVNETMEGTVEMVEPSGNGLAKTIIVGTLLTTGIAVVMYVRKKRKLKQLNEKTNSTLEDVK